MTAQHASTAQATDRLSHEALLYRGQAELVDAVVDFARAGAEAGEPVLVALPRANLELIGNALNGHADGVGFRDMTVLGHNPSCVLAAYEEWIAGHDRPVRLVGELIWPGRTRAETVECLRHEALLNHALAGARASILCPYDAQKLAAEVVEGAALTHPKVIVDGVSGRSDRYGDPIEVHAAAHWPQEQATGPVSEHAFNGDLSQLRQAIATDPVVSSLDRARVTDLVLAVNEAATNAVRHGDGTCLARLWSDGTEVISEIHTDSVIDDPVAGCRRPSPGARSGRGLWLINQLCDLVELRSSQAGTTLRMHLRARRSPTFRAVRAG